MTGGVGIGLGLNVGGDVVAFFLQMKDTKKILNRLRIQMRNSNKSVDTLLIGTINMRCLKDNMMLV